MDLRRARTAERKKIEAMLLRRRKSNKYTCITMISATASPVSETAYVLAMMMTGGSDPDLVDAYRLDFRNSRVRPSLADFKKAVKIFEPREAFIDHSFNSQRLKRSDLVDVGANDPCPDIINWLQYCNGSLVKRMGGIAHCLKTPAFKTEKLLDGVLIQLTEKWFEPNNPEHLDVQLCAMRHLKLIS